MDRLPLHLSQASGVPFYRQIVDQMAELIRSGQLAPGARLPSYRELAPQLLVSLITVRRAYSDLERASLIVLKQGQGTFVGEDVKAASQQRALAEARQVLSQALVRARQLGLTGGPLRAAIKELLALERGESDGRE